MSSSTNVYKGIIPVVCYGKEINRGKRYRKKIRKIKQKKKFIEKKTIRNEDERLK